MHGRAEEADRITSALEQRVQADTGAPLPPPEIVAGEKEQEQGSWMEICSPQYRYGFASWVPTLWIQHGLTVTKSLEYTFIKAIANPIGPLIGMAIATRSNASGISA